MQSDNKSYDINNDDPMIRDKAYNELASDLFKIDFDNPEFLFIMLCSIQSLLLKKGLISESDIATEVEEIGQNFKLMKYRKNLLDKQSES